ncbi:fanconi-associated nuclease 1 homolog isoform X1 [Magnolia sinica]|uniref:fanconi-associated nuclease 1 homolog isoform X1 n=1 Tax=Magnolia sinica TaxID=86752 RepID=UPI0026592DAD|nr:fanconi-associated nuclease 1 homolog isoform X1 [Magnolia sinica]
MLTGRESLMRMVGRRRRTLSPNTTSFLLSDQYQSCSSIILKEEENIGKSSFLMGKEGSSNQVVGKSDKQQQQQYCNLDWVTCPVCGSIVRGADYTVNSHLDACLARGKKRKLTQHTLLQFSFSSRPKDSICLSESDNAEDDARRKGSDENTEPSTVCILPKYGAAENKERNKCTSDFIYSLQSNFETCATVLDENVNKEDATNCGEVDSSIPLSSLLDVKMPTHDIYSTGIGMAATTLGTYIVGRRFHDEVDLAQGAGISLLRDPENVKDPNAIKVLHTDSGRGQMLGFLPRGLAKYLSPLIDKYCLEFKGSVTSLPNHPHDAIPIRLVCQEMTTCCQMEANDRQLFESLWRNAVHVAECENAFPASTTKYQRNFHILMQEVLKQHSHLFTDDEKSFLGPWFRMSNISYPEISDSQQAVEELRMAEYFRSLEFTKEPSKTDIREVLDLLTVSELREISTLVLSKKGIHCAKKEELVRWLFAAYEDGICPSLPNMVLEQTGTCIQITSTAEFLVWRIQRLFFLNGEQDLSSFLLVDLGLVKYPAYTCNISQHVFADRSDLVAYEEAIEVAQVMDQSLDVNNMEMVMRCIEISEGCMSASLENASCSSMGTFLSRFSASWVYSKAVTLGISFFERERRYEDAIRLLKSLLNKFTCDSRRGYWTLRLSVDLEHMGYLNESLSLAEEGVLDPWVRAGSKMALQRRVLRLGKPPRRWKTPSFAESVNRKIKEVHVRGRPLNCETGMKNRFYGDDEDQCGVEQLALQYYAGEGGGWQGVHTESGIWMTIFGLLMWDTIFADIPDVFWTKFQVQCV